MRWTRDERVQISLRTAQFSYVVVASTSRELNLAILPISLTSKDRSFCRGGFNKPCTWNDPFLRSFFIHSSSAYSLQVWSVKHNTVDFVFFENHFWNTYGVFDAIRFKYILKIFILYILLNFPISYRFTGILYVTAEKSFQKFHLKYGRNSRIIAPTRKRWNLSRSFFLSDHTSYS